MRPSMGELCSTLQPLRMGSMHDTSNSSTAVFVPELDAACVLRT